MYINKSARLHNRCLAYLELIDKANKRLDNAASRLHYFDNERNFLAPIRLMNMRYQIEDDLTRFQELSDWLVNRYQVVMSELIAETCKRIPLLKAS